MEEKVIIFNTTNEKRKKHYKKSEYPIAKVSLELPLLSKRKNFELCSCVTM